jgi:hypothetical protein
MQFSTITLLGLIAYVSAAPFEKRTGTTITNEIVAINNRLAVMDGNVNSYVSGLGGIIPFGSLLFNLALLSVEDAALDLDINTSGALSSTDSPGIATAVTITATTFATIATDTLNNVCQVFRDADPRKLSPY